MDTKVNDVSEMPEEEVSQMVKDAKIGTVITFRTTLPNETLINHEHENVIKVGKDQYAAFNYTGGKDAQFFSFAELVKLISEGGSTTDKPISFRVIQISEPKYSKD